jgi:mono/diheme cytochrome c family protein
MKSSRLFALLAGVGLIAALGCGHKKGPAPSGTTPAVASAATGGQQVFEQNCAKCHNAAGIAAPPPDEGKGGPGGKGGRRRGPDLSHVGSDAEHSVDWLAQHVRDPKAHKPDSRMPSFENKLTPEQIKSVAEFLAGMK